MICEATYSGKGLKVYLSINDCEKLLLIVAKAPWPGIAEHNDTRRQLLEALSTFNYGDADAWQRIPGAIT
jgi:hypothetical protein